MCDKHIDDLLVEIGKKINHVVNHKTTIKQKLVLLAMVDTVNQIRNGEIK